VHQVEAAPVQLNRLQVGLQIEASYLSGQPVIAGTLKDFNGEGSWPQVPIYDEHLLLGAYAVHTALNTVMLQHERECSQISQHSLREFLQLSLVKLLFDVMLSHTRPNLPILIFKVLSQSSKFEATSPTASSEKFVQELAQT